MLIGSDVVMLLRKEFIYINRCAEICFIIIFFKLTFILITNRETKSERFHYKEAQHIMK